MRKRVKSETIRVLSIEKRGRPLLTIQSTTDITYSSVASDFALLTSSMADRRRKDKGIAVVAMGKRRVEPLPTVHDAVDPEHLVGGGGQGRRSEPPKVGGDEFECGAADAEVGLEKGAEG
ncbi:acyl-CoA N-acyltransferases super family protein [Striga asiatica]|uniref:Acyl-CoA N-acyltransferases super family protein n=1 Tax=Striga asiatica TaxID=4170 RepID=A0A5A7P3D0_STRAF|nr:acyl-CoA N-acyltransferases super family protein [Striga asiatica]